MTSSELYTKENCCGCKACSNACPRDAIEFKCDELGFFFPSIDVEKCIDCGLCASSCDFQKDIIEKNTPIKSFAAVNKDTVALKKSSSGGVFWALAEITLEKGGTVCGCVYNENLEPIHICADKEDECVRMRGSKYVQSDIGFVYREIKEKLKSGKQVLFTGTPCQVAALQSVLLRKKYDNLITVDLVCHGVPSALMFKKYLEYLEEKYNTEIVGYSFRSKRYGWQRFTSEFTDSKGRVKNIGKINEFYQTEFTNGNIMRESCFHCKYATPERVGDFTIGDFWGHEKVNITMDVSKGLSICTANTQKAIDTIPALSEKLHLIDVEYKIIVKGNKCLHMPTPKGKKWEQYMDALKQNEIPKIAKQYVIKNKKSIFRNKLRLYVPNFLFRAVRRNKYGK